MDVVVLYVNCDDLEWQKDYHSKFKTKYKPNRFRDWGTFKYWFRGIAKNLPWIDNIYLVVSRKSQVPSWLDTSKVKVVLHEDIIPNQFLPIFNSCGIEIFIPFIKGLSEEFLYFNDDIFVMNPCGPATFFENGKSHCYLRERNINRNKSNTYRHQCLNSTNYAREALGMESTETYLFPHHWASPMYKSDCLEVFGKCKDKIHAQMSPLRTPENVNQYIYLDYQFLKGHTTNAEVSHSYVAFDDVSILDVVKRIRSGNKKILCINDAGVSPEKYPMYKQQVLGAFKVKFPVKCKYEK
jgi:hypothetical protein